MNQIFLLAMISLVVAVASAIPRETKSQNKPQIKHNFTLGYENFILDDKPFQMISGEMHYPRIPREAWRHRIQMAKSMGLNSIGTYVFWNVHEPQKGSYDFTRNNDIEEFLRICQEEEMWVVLRPSPYVCAEWEYGGYPYWLQNEKDIEIRSKDIKYLDIYKKYITELGKRLSPFLVNKGGPVLMVQVENEYGSFGNDKEYLEINRKIFIEAGFDGILFTCDPKNAIKDGHLPGILATINGEENPDEIKKLIKENNGGRGPFYMAEWYPAWYDWWGTSHHIVPADKFSIPLDSILGAGISINMYMFHGGSTRGFMNGANFDYTPLMPHYRPQISSYDYDAPLDEAGNPTYKFHKFREIIQKHLPKEKSIPPIPPSKPATSIKNIVFNQQLSIYDIIEGSSLIKVENNKPLSFEMLDQAYGFVLYRTKLRDLKKGGKLQITELRDYAVVLVDKEQVGVLDRMKDENTLELESKRGENIYLDILVENLGRINFGSELVHNFKGITEKVVLNGVELLDWTMYNLSFDRIEDFVSVIPQKKHFTVSNPLNVPSIKKGSFELSETIDSYLDFSNWGKGVAFVNGYNLGRYWSIGPQQTIYLPAEWLKVGENEISIFELLTPHEDHLEGIDKAILNIIKSSK